MASQRIPEDFSIRVYAINGNGIRLVRNTKPEFASRTASQRIPEDLSIRVYAIHGKEARLVRNTKRELVSKPSYPQGQASQGQDIKVMAIQSKDKENEPLVREEGEARPVRNIKREFASRVPPFGHDPTATTRQEPSTLSSVPRRMINPAMLFTPPSSPSRAPAPLKAPAPKRFVEVLSYSPRQGAPGDPISIHRAGEIALDEVSPGPMERPRCLAIDVGVPNLGTIPKRCKIKAAVIDRLGFVVEDFVFGTFDYHPRVVAPDKVSAPWHVASTEA